ncbi:Leucine-rich repeat flightless-interacting protein 2-like [Oopsacas minuta]|uniref:Leucine-rich repeat flightless-interacting protein 2-like n=1 Tax=Oopsacas minuta TaxID=111878 RepID=A0AAV7JAT9_9METZ|nr:Leucine-rich repeat flightless-interacting protein 2-like [Oopsacas minuta]
MNSSDTPPSARRGSAGSSSLNKYSCQDSTSMSALHHRSIQGNIEHEKKRDILMQGGKLLRERQTSEDASINSAVAPGSFDSVAQTPEQNSPKLHEYPRYSSQPSESSHLHNGVIEEASLGTNKIKRQYKERLLEIAELENDKTLLQYKTSSLQDCLDDTNQEIRECRELSKRQASELLLLNQNISVLQSEKDSLHCQVKYRDDYLEKHNLTLPYIGADGELVESKVRDFAYLLREKEDELEGLVVVSSAMAMDYVEDFYSDDDTELGDVCSLCKQGLTALDPLIMSKIKGIVKDLLEMGCDKAPIPKCSWFAKKIAKYAAKYVKKYLEHDKLCKLVKVCESDESVQITANDLDLSDDETACVKCQVLMKKIKAVIMNDKAVLNSIVLGAMDECDQDDEVSADECMDMMNRYSVSLTDEAIRDFPELEMCSAMEKCEYSE